MNCANIAATIHNHLVSCPKHGYTQGANRFGSGDYCKVNAEGNTYKVREGDRDCSSSIIDSWRIAISDTPYKGKLDAATYTGNMKQVFVASGLFDWHPMGDGYIAQRGDIYLNEVNHTAMCQTAVPDILSEFNLNEFGGIVGGQVGDQTGRESLTRPYYNFPWDGILAYNHKADKVGWIKDSKGWWYKDNDGSWPKNTWRFINDKWYWFNSSGYAACNVWKQIKNVWYHFDYDCSAAKGWRYIGKEWYYFDTNSCKMQTGWRKINGKWYWLDPKDGEAARNCWKKLNGIWYRFHDGCDAAVGWGSFDGNWYYFNSDCKMQTGWVIVKGVWYYLRKGKDDKAKGPEGAMLSNGTYFIDGKNYKFDGSGACLNP